MRHDLGMGDDVATPPTETIETPAAAVEDQECFVISPIGPEGGAVRRRADQVLKYVIDGVVAKRGYLVVRADTITQPGRIDSQLLEHVVGARLVIADLTGANANVFYELAVRHALAKPFVQICEKGDVLPFDIQGLRTIFFDHTDLDSVHQAKVDLDAHVQAVERMDKVDTPLSVTVDLASLRSSQDPSDRLEAETLRRLTSIENRMSRLSNPNAVARADYESVQELLEANLQILTPQELEGLAGPKTSAKHKAWVQALLSRWATDAHPGREPWEPWADTPTKAAGHWSEEPPF